MGIESTRLRLVKGEDSSRGPLSKGKSLSRPKTKANEAMHPVVVSERAFLSPSLTKHAFYADDTAMVFNMDVNQALSLLA